MIAGPSRSGLIEIITRKDITEKCWHRRAKFEPVGAPLICVFQNFGSIWLTCILLAARMNLFNNGQLKQLKFHGCSILEIMDS